MTDFQRFKAYCKKFAIIGAAIGVASIVMLLFGMLLLPALLGFAAIVLLIGSLMFYRSGKKTFCKCGHHYDYETEVAWSQLDSYVSNDSQQRLSRIEFECYCGQCGEKSSFIEKFQTASVDKNGNVRYTNIKESAKKFFVFKY